MDLAHKITLKEEDGKIVLDITDHTGGFGLKLFMTPVEAHRFGSGLQERARLFVSRGDDKPKRISTDDVQVLEVAHVG